MRQNLPVTQREYTFPADQTLISVTDLKGRITYCNRNFVIVSGFSQDELLGQPHNLVRHPDMPEEAFRDMWDTLQAGLPWSALVKNRRKNGDHYWVRANASPVRDGGRIVGYMSVRTAATREEIAAAEQLYTRINQDAARGQRRITLHRGKAVRPSWIGRVQLALRPDLRSTAHTLFWTPPVAISATWLLEAPPQATLPILVALAAAASLWAQRGLLGPLAEVRDALRLTAAGELSQNRPPRHRGILGDMEMALNQLILGVRTVVRDTRHEVANLKTGAGEISNNSKDLSARAESQASSLQQTAAALEQITGTVRNTAQQAQNGAKLAEQATASARTSLDAVQAASQTMAEIAESSRKIGDILRLIEGVAFQTNILALNAAVEAARAGEHGRGFAVVASEVRALAQRTTAAAKDVRELIAESQQGVRKGADISAQAVARMRETLDNVAQTAQLLAQIETAAREQDLGIEQINQAVGQLDTLTQQNAAAAHELASVASSQAQLVQEVHHTIRVFKLTPRDKTLAEEDAVALRQAARARLEQSASEAKPPRLR